jgi:iron complex outermembrane recepter protein
MKIIFIFMNERNLRAGARTPVCAMFLAFCLPSVITPAPAWGQAQEQGSGADRAALPAPASAPVPTEERHASREVENASQAQPIEVVVTAARRPERIDAVPGSITVLSKEEVRAEAANSNGSLGDALGKVVPGLGRGSETQSTFGQTLRGRKVLVLIDGIPQHTIRNVARDLQTISPLAVERIEVIRGTTPLYGEGAAGGIISIITRKPTEEGVKLTTDVTIGTAPRNPIDGLSGSVAQAVAGRRGRLDYTVQGSLERTTGIFDAEGDRIPPDPHGQGGLADLWTWNVFGRVGVAPTPVEKIDLSASYYQNVQQTEFATDPSVNTAPPGTRKARAVRGLDLEDPQGTRNVLASASYRHVRVLGGDLTAQIYFRNYVTRFFPFDGREIASYGAIIQARLESQRLGGRLQANTPLTDRLSALYGLDISGERTAQPVAIQDPRAYDASGGLVFRKTRFRTWVPRMEIGNLAPFAQLQWNVTDWLSLRGGAREELIGLSVDDYSTLAGNDVEGGRLHWSETLLNAGVVVTLPARFSTFASFTQGYSLPDVGLILRNANDPEDRTLENLETEPQLVNAVEIGVRREGGSVNGSVAAFYNTSALGVSAGGFSTPVVRAPERVYGVEATIEARFLDTWRVGAAVSWLEGELDKKDDGAFTYLNTYRIPPPKVSATIGTHVRPGWDVQLLGVYSGPRDRFAAAEEPGFGERPVEPFLLCELLSTADVGPGRLRIGVANVLNRQITPVTSQLLWSGTNTSNAAGSGARGSIGYSVTY